MTIRRACATLLLAVLSLGAAVGIWRSIQPDGPSDPAHRLAAQLRCPACQGESVADSRSPIAAAMRAVIDAQLAQGRRPDEIRAYLVTRYGPEVLAAPPARGLGLLLWTAPAAALFAGLAPVTVRAARRRRARGDGAASPTTGRRTAALGVRTWNIGAACLLSLVGGVAVLSPRLSGPEPAGAPEPISAQLALAKSMEEQGRYDAAAEVYRAALERQPDDEIRLRLAFTLIRAGQSEEAARLANQALANEPDDPDGLLLLGLAQRDSDAGTATTTLRRFLARAPQHPAAAEIRRLLDPG